MVPLHISGVVALSSGFGGDTRGDARRLAEVSIVAEGGQCTATDSEGRYACTVPLGWTGRVVARKSNYRFAPSALTYQNLRNDARQQDFAAVYDPR